jgi:hypothetical protein
VASKAGRGEGWRAGREKTFFSSRLRILSTFPFVCERPQPPPPKRARARQTGKGNKIAATDIFGGGGAVLHFRFCAPPTPTLPCPTPIPTHPILLTVASRSLPKERERQNPKNGQRLNDSDSDSAGKSSQGGQRKEKGR